MGTTRRRFELAGLALALLMWVLAPADCFAAGGIRVYRTTEEALALAYPTADRFDAELITITPELRAALEDRLKRPFPFRGVRVHHAHLGEVHLGRAVVTEEIGKYRPMTFLLAVDPDDVVTRVDLLKFRESHGYQVESRTFMNQYRGLERGDPIRVGKDIDAISGATLSARGVSKGVKRMLYFFEVLDRVRAEGEASESTAEQAPD